MTIIFPHCIEFIIHFHTLYLFLCFESFVSPFSGEIIDADCDEKEQSTKYKLVGVVVHSGQASGGHYYSYILHRYFFPLISECIYFGLDIIKP